LPTGRRPIASNRSNTHFKPECIFRIPSQQTRKVEDDYPTTYGQTLILQSGLELVPDWPIGVAALSNAAIPMESKHSLAHLTWGNLPLFRRTKRCLLEMPNNSAACLSFRTFSIGYLLWQKGVLFSLTVSTGNYDHNRWCSIWFLTPTSGRDPAW